MISLTELWIVVGLAVLLGVAYTLVVHFLSGLMRRLGNHPKIRAAYRKILRRRAKGPKDYGVPVLLEAVHTPADRYVEYVWNSRCSSPYLIYVDGILIRWADTKERGQAIFIETVQEESL